MTSENGTWNFSLRRPWRNAVAIYYSGWLLVFFFFTTIQICGKWFEPRSLSRRLQGFIVQVRVVPRRTLLLVIIGDWERKIFALSVNTLKEMQNLQMDGIFSWSTPLWTEKMTPDHENVWLPVKYGASGVCLVVSNLLKEEEVTSFWVNKSVLLKTVQLLELQNFISSRFFPLGDNRLPSVQLLLGGLVIHIQRFRRKSM